ncbi:MAG: hypothetical protein KGL97_09230, partial [Alphaproteobacteria bacterium]|nr:hypothetical protein [Alphaproteobacteria bacterium]
MILGVFEQTKHVIPAKQREALREPGSTGTKAGLGLLPNDLNPDCPLRGSRTASLRSASGMTGLGSNQNRHTL